MLRLKNLLYKKPSFIYHFGKKTFKVFTPIGKPFKMAEIQGNREALNTDFWINQVIEVVPNLFSLEMVRGEPIRHNDWHNAEDFIESKLLQALTYPRSPSHQAYNFSYLKTLEDYGLDIGLLSWAEEALMSVYLPVTSAHGDLHLDNMVYVGQEIKIIDWSMFTGLGSFVTDYIHFYNSKTASKNKESWTKSIFKKQEYLIRLAKQVDAQPSQLRLAYSLSRISGEISQRENFSLITKKEISKYNFVLNKILNEFKEAHVQRSDSDV